MGTKFRSVSYSVWGKITAFLLIIISFAAAFSFLADMIVSTDGANELFEKDYVSSIDSVQQIQSAYDSIEKLFELKNEDHIINELGRVEYDKQLEDKLKKLESAKNFLIAVEGIYYYASDGENVFTNCDMTTAGEFRKFDLYNLVNGYSTESTMSFHADIYIPQERNQKVFIASEKYAKENTEVMYSHLNILISLKSEEYIRADCLKERNEEIQNNLKELAISYNFLKNPEGIYYYAADGENVFTNCDMTTADEFKSFKYYNITDGYSEDLKISNSIYASFSADRKMFIAFDDNYITQKQSQFEQVKAALQKELQIILALFVICLLMLVYLIFVCGRDKDKNINLLTIDRLWTELTFGAIMIVISVFSIIAVNTIHSRNMMIYYTEFKPVVMAVTAVFCAIGLMFLLSAVRHIKNRTLIKHSLTYIACRKIRFISKVIFDITPLTVKVMGAVIAAEFIAIIATAILWGGSHSFLLFFLILISGTAGALYFIIKHVLKPYDHEVKTRLELSLNREMKAERLKTELITNVSHDLKTPLTAIINYSDLLAKQDNSNEYAKIIYEKSQKLKTLTEDLFEVSKAQSGNIAANIEDLSVSELISQTLAEFDEYTVDFKLNVQNVSILADGKLMSRVFENLIGNTIKYALPNTRAYIDAFEKDSKIHITFKNISNYEMNFESGEMTERFSRGDTSRATDGNGLGLAIAQSYTEACGGKLNIDIDGDLFKVTIIF